MANSEGRNHLRQNSTDTTILKHDTMQMAPIPKPRNRKEWNDWWHHPPHGTKDAWRARFGDSGKRCYRAFPEPEDWITRKQERGMEAFVRLEKSLLRRMGQEPYRQAGVNTFERYGHDGEPKTVFVALDFEGNTSQGIAAFGMAVFSGEEADIPVAHFGLNKWNRRRFLFGRSVNIALSELRQTIMDCIEDVRVEHSQANIVLVGHSIHCEMLVLEYLDLPLEALPIHGYVDTQKLSKELLHVDGTLAALLRNLNIEWPSHALHCAGNDAYFTMRALLALLLMRHRACTGPCHNLVKQPWAEPKRQIKEKPAPDRDVHLDGDINPIDMPAT